MTKKDYELIAGVIDGLHESKQTFEEEVNFSDDQVEELATVFCNTLSRTNPLFNREKFLKACGVAND